MPRQERSSSFIDWVAFGQWIQKEQARVGISDRELARRSGMSATHIGMVKRGTTGLGDVRFLALVHALGLTENDAKKAMSLNRPDITPEEREVLEALHRVPEHDKSRFTSIVKAASQAFTHSPN